MLATGQWLWSHPLIPTRLTLPTRQFSRGRPCVFALTCWLVSHLDCSQFIAKDIRPSAAAISATPAISWKVEWKLVERSSSETEVVRKVVEFQQSMHRWLPMHLILPFTWAAEHTAMVKNFVKARRSR